MKRHARLLAALLACACCAARASPPAYALRGSVALGTPDRWDYLSFDAASHRVFVAHGDHTDVVDAASGRVLGRLAGLHGAHGQAVAASGEIYADSGQDGTVTVFDATSFKTLATVQAGKDADALIYEPKHRLIAVLNGDAQSATLIDTKTHAVRATVALGGEPEAAAADGTGAIYVNMASTREIVKLDAAAGHVVARFAVPACLSPHGLAVDAQTHRLFASCANARLLVVDAEHGIILQDLPIGKGSDTVAFDPVRRLVFSSNAEGTLSVFREQGGTLLALGDVPTAYGARTMATDPQTGRVFLVTADVDTSRPAVQGPHGLRRPWKPGTVKLLLMDRRPDDG